MLINTGETPKHFKLWWLFVLIIFIKSLVLAFMFYPYHLPFCLDIFKYSIIYIPFILFIMSFSFIFKGQVVYYYLLIIDVLVSAILFADALYFQAFGTPISFYILPQYSCLEDLNASIISLIRPIHFIFLIDLPFMLAYVLYKKTADTRNIRLFAVLVLISFIPCAFQIYSFQLQCLPTYAVIQSSPIGYHIFDLINVIRDKNYSLSKNEESQINDWMNQNRELNQGMTSELQGSLHGKNLIVIQFESLETFVINQKVEDQEVTPEINRLLKHSLYFPNIITQISDGGSGDAEFVFNTSLYPLKRGAVFYRFPDNTYPSLPNVLKKNGYGNVAIHGDDPRFWNRNAAFPNLGFDKFIGEDSLVSDEIIGMGLSDVSMYHQTVSIIREMAQPYYAFIITLTSHIPFNIPDDKKRLNFKEPLDSRFKAYYNSMNYSDRALGYFIEELKQQKMLDNTVLVIYGDHDSYHRYFDKTKKINDKRIPFIIYNPSIDPQVSQKYGGQIDMYPTLASLFGINGENYVSGTMGKNLLSTNNGFAVLPDGEYVSDPQNKEHNLQGLDIADLIIRSNYFGSGHLEP